MLEKTTMEKEIKNNGFQPQEEFIRQVIFMRDDEKVLAIFPFYHNISDREYEMVVKNFFDQDVPLKRAFCLMHEEEFGWGWIHNEMMNHLSIATYDEYEDFQNMLVSSKVIKETFILNEH
jgi:hypothetical protein